MSLAFRELPFRFLSFARCLSTGYVAPKFLDRRVQALLSEMTGLDMDKVFSPRIERLRVPQYQLMSEEQLAKAEEETIDRAKKLLRMPPVLELRKEINETIECDEMLDGHDKDNTSMVFTDISQSVHNRDRRIVVREPNGVLRQARWCERDKMNQIYFPVKGRKLHVPPLLLSENLQVVFAEGRHEYVLDVVNVQCDPDSEDYIRVHHETYEDIDKRRCHDVLHSTRHYGGMIYYLVKNQHIDNLLLNILEADRVDDAERLIKLCHLLHPNTESASQCKQKGVSGMELVEMHLRVQGPQKGLKYFEQLEKRTQSIQGSF